MLGFYGFLDISPLKVKNIKKKLSIF